MSLASLDIGSPAWRSARVAAAIGALSRGEDPADEVLGVLAALGPPPEGWLSVLAAARTADSVVLLLPRPGDPRGLALPRGQAAGGTIGWTSPGGSTWLLPVEESRWQVFETPGHVASPHDAHEADRLLRACVVQAAHAIDRLTRTGSARGAASRRAQEALVDSWVLGPPALPSGARQLAALGLRMLLAIDDAGTLVDTVALESVARTAVEAAFSTTSASG